MTTLNLELPESARAFDLRRGEAVRLYPCEAACYIYLSQGRLQVVTPAGESVDYTPDIARRRPLALSGDALTDITAEEDTLLYVLDQETLDIQASWDELNSSIASDDPELGRRLAMLRNCKSFRRLPAANVKAALERMVEHRPGAGDGVMQQGDQGDNFYLIESGHAEVWQTGLYDDAPRKVAELGPGDSFGEEALITGGTRSATVRMATDGSLLALDQADYRELVQNSLLHEVGPEDGKALVEQGYGLLDVRYEEEHEETHIPGCTLVPLHELRARVDELDRKRKYVVYCRSGRRSAVAALLLRERSIEALSMSGGINGWPYDTASLY